MTDTKKYDTNFKNQWCPGCGNFGILAAMKDALAAREIPPENLLIVSGIGQAAKTPHFIQCNMFHSLHGRALPLALGAKLANRDLNIIVNSGDGDCYGEGGNHFIHAIRRNTDLTLLVHNNQVYGLTKGQASPTSSMGMTTPLQPRGVISTPINGPALALTLGAGFVARGFSGCQEHLSRLIQAALSHKGFSMIDILQPCVSFNKINTHDWYKERVKEMDNPNLNDVKKAMELATADSDRIPIGIFLAGESHDFISRIPDFKTRPLVSIPYDKQSTTAVLESVQSL